MIIKCGVLRTDLTRELCRYCKYGRVLVNWYVFGGGKEIKKKGKVTFIYRYNTFYTEYTQKKLYLPQCNFLDALLEYGFHLHKQTYVAHRGLRTGRDKHCIHEGFHLYMMLGIRSLQLLLCQLSSQCTSFPFYRRSENIKPLQKQCLCQESKYYWR